MSPTCRAAWSPGSTPSCPRVADHSTRAKAISSGPAFDPDPAGRPPARHLLLAGAFGPERVPVRPDPDDPRWFEPPHVRDAAAARERLAAQVVAGADVIVAPAWLTHRRALLPVGETRQVAAWTAAAVRIAREAVEVGSERRGGRDPAAEDEGPTPSSDEDQIDRPVPLVAGPLPGLDVGSEPETGRLLPREAATERDYRDQAGVLADSRPDVLLVEGQRDAAEHRAAVAEAVESGLPVWVAPPAAAIAREGLEAWSDRYLDMGVAQVLLPGPPLERGSYRDELPWGAQVSAVGEVRAWLDAGAGMVALLDGADPSRLTAVRTAIDEFERPALEAASQERLRWQRHLDRAGAAAPGGAALRIGSAAIEELPAGFAWTVAGNDEIGRLPLGHYRFTVMRARTSAEIAAVMPALEVGGLVTVACDGPPPAIEGLRLLWFDAAGTPVLATYRREP